MGERGRRDAEAMAASTAQRHGLPAGGGLRRLDRRDRRAPARWPEVLRSGIPQAAAAALADGSRRAAEAIRTTDTFAKLASTARCAIGGGWVHVAGIAKGSGMLEPDMATMLSFVVERRRRGAARTCSACPAAGGRRDLQPRHGGRRGLDQRHAAAASPTARPAMPPAAEPAAAPGAERLRGSAVLREVAEELARHAGAGRRGRHQARHRRGVRGRRTPPRPSGPHGASPTRCW